MNSKLSAAAVRKDEDNPTADRVYEDIDDPNKTGLASMMQPTQRAGSGLVTPRFSVGDPVIRSSGGEWFGMGIGDIAVVLEVIPTPNNWHQLRLDGFDGLYSDFNFAKAPAVPGAASPADGWVIMPREPSETMLDAADRARALPKAFTREQYAAMVDTAPQPPRADTAPKTGIEVTGFYRKCSADTPGAEWGEGIGHYVHDEQARIEGQAAAAALRQPVQVDGTIELCMTPIGNGLPTRDELRGEQTILTYNDKAGTWNIAFMESGWDDFGSGFALGVTHWLDITSMWPGVIAQVAAVSQHVPDDEESVERAAEVIWNDLFAARAGAWDKPALNSITGIQFRATARAVLAAARGVY